MVHLLKRTIYETYEYDPKQICTILEIPLEDLTEDRIIEFFTEHDGSIYGDDLFAQLDVDVGHELDAVEEDA